MYVPGLTNFCSLFLGTFYRTALVRLKRRGTDNCFRLEHFSNNGFEKISEVFQNRTLQFETDFLFPPGAVTIQHGKTKRPCSEETNAQGVSRMKAAYRARGEG